MWKSILNWFTGMGQSCSRRKENPEKPNQAFPKSPSPSRRAIPSTSTNLKGDPPPSSRISIEGDGEAKAVYTRRKRLPNVLQSTIVEDRLSAIPSVSLLVLRNDTADRISKLMDKLDSLDLDSGSPEPHRKSV